MPGIEARAPERTETSSGLSLSPNLLPVMRPTSASAAFTCCFKLLRIAVVVGVIVGADLGGDGEAGRHRQPETGHLGEARALAAEEIAHVGAAFGLAAAEGVDPRALRLCGRGRFCTLSALWACTLRARLGARILRADFDLRILVCGLP